LQLTESPADDGPRGLYSKVAGFARGNGEPQIKEKRSAGDT
jgi:hypothetical protein